MTQSWRSWGWKLGLASCFTSDRPGAKIPVGEATSVAGSGHRWLPEVG